MSAPDTTTLLAQLDAAITLLAEWSMAVERESSWDGWDSHYKNAHYNPGPLRALIDTKIAALSAKRDADSALPLCPACVLQTTSGGEEPGAMAGFRTALPGERCSAPDCLSSDPKCEGCDSPATTMDSEGVDLCGPCAQDSATPP